VTTDAKADLLAAADQAAKAALDEHLRVIGGIIRDAVKDLAGDRVGFCLLLCDDLGNATLSSSIFRPALIEFLKEVVRELESLK